MPDGLFKKVTRAARARGRDCGLAAVNRAGASRWRDGFVVHRRQGSGDCHRQHWDYLRACLQLCLALIGELMGSTFILDTGMGEILKLVWVVLRNLSMLCSRLGCWYWRFRLFSILAASKAALPSQNPAKI